jgi:hypothetical protein
MKKLSKETLSMLEKIRYIIIKNNTRFHKLTHKMWLMTSLDDDAECVSLKVLDEHDNKQRHIGALTAICDINSDVVKMLDELTK